MGGLIRAPKPAAAPAPAVAAPPAPAPAAEDPAQAEADRRRRGMAATIATSARGLSDDSRIVPARKTLLGE